MNSKWNIHLSTFSKWWFTSNAAIKLSRWSKLFKNPKIIETIIPSLNWVATCHKDGVGNSSYQDAQLTINWHYFKRRSGNKTLLKPMMTRFTDANHDDVIKWKYFPRYWPFVREIHRSPVNFPHKGQWRGALMFTLICARMNGWVNNGEAGDLRRYLAHYDVIVMSVQFKSFPPGQNGRHFADIRWSNFMNQKSCILIRISPKLILKGLIGNKSALVCVMAWRK